MEKFGENIPFFGVLFGAFFGTFFGAFFDEQFLPRNRKKIRAESVLQERPLKKLSGGGTTISPVRFSKRGK